MRIPIQSSGRIRGGALPPRGITPSQTHSAISKHPFGLFNSFVDPMCSGPLADLIPACHGYLPAVVRRRRIRPVLAELECFSLETQNPFHPCFVCKTPHGTVMGTTSCFAGAPREGRDARGRLVSAIAADAGTPCQED